MSVRALTMGLLAAMMSGHCTGHLCLIYPAQRGPMDISQSGSHTCFRHGAPCGGQDAAPPTVTLFAGQQMFIKWQQNYNHYTVGFPGFMDIAIAPVNSENFTLLAFVPDEYVFAQDHQQNYTAVVVVPDITCDHCVIRGRYQSHKPGETPFYQCADVKIFKSRKHFRSLSLPRDTAFKPVRSVIDLHKNSPTSTQQSGNFMLQGFAYNKFESDVLHFVNISLGTGAIHPLNTFKLGIDDRNEKPFQDKLGKENVTKHIQNIHEDPSRNFLMDGIAALNPGQSEMLTVYHNGGSMEVGATNVMVFFTNNGTVETTLSLHSFNNIPISGFSYVKPRTYVSFGMVATMTPGSYSFVLGKVTYVPGTGLVYEELYRTSELENLYVNYQWLEYDPDKGLVYVLMGNENSADQLHARIYTFDFINPSLVRHVEVDVTGVTFMSMQLHRATGKLYAVAPGGHYSEKRPIWALVEVSPETGTVSGYMEVAKKGLFERYYGGTIFDGMDQNNGVLYHVMRMADTVADVIVAIDIPNRTTKFSSLCNLRHVHNLSLSPN